MTIETISNKITHNPDGIEKDFAYDFEVQSEGDMVVYADGELYMGAFTISGLGDPLGGTVSFDDPPSSDIDELILRRLMTITQTYKYPTYGPFPSSSHENNLDRIYMIMQQIQEEVNRSIKQPINEDPDLDITFPPYTAGRALIYSRTEKRLSLSDADLDNIVTESTAARDAAIAAAATATSAASSAESSANLSSASATLAEKWATEDIDVPVVGTDYSAYHWAKKAEQIIVNAQITRMVRQAVLTSPGMIATPDTETVCATKTGDLRSTYHDLGIDMLTGSRGGMILTKDTVGTLGHQLQASILGEYRNRLQTNLTDTMDTSATLLNQMTASGVELLSSSTLSDANLLALNTTHEKWMSDGSYWQYNPLSGFAMFMYPNMGGAHDLLHPMGKKPLLFAIKGIDTTYQWITGRRDSSGFMGLNLTNAEADGTGVFTGKHTDQVLNLASNVGLTTGGDEYFGFGFFGDDLSDLHDGMAGIRGVSAQGVIPANSGSTTIDTGITDTQMILYKSTSDTSDWNFINIAAGVSNKTFLNTAEAEVSGTGVTVSGTEVTFPDFTTKEWTYLVVGSTAISSSTKIKEGSKTVRKVGTAATGHRVDLGHDFVSGDNGGMVMGRGVESTVNNFVFDTLRGATNFVATSLTDAEMTNVNTLTAFTTTGFECGVHSGFNNTGINQYTVFPTTEKVTTPDGLVWWIDRKTGFAMCKSVGDSVIGRTLDTPFGDNKVPIMLWIKDLDSSTNWVVYNKFLTSSDYFLVLNGQNTETLNSNMFNAEPTTETITLGSNAAVNADGDEYIIYGWFGTDISDAQDGSLYGVEGATAFFWYEAASGSLSVDTKVTNPSSMLQKATDTIRDWYWHTFIDAGTILYSPNTTAVELANANITLDGSLLNVGSSNYDHIYCVFGSGIESGIDDQVIIPASANDPFIVSLAEGVDIQLGYMDNIYSATSQLSLTLTGPAGKRYIKIDKFGVLSSELEMPEYLRGYVPYAKGNYVYDIDRSVMTDDTGVDTVSLFIGECSVDEDGNVYDIISYASGDFWESEEFTPVPEAYKFFGPVFGHKEIDLVLRSTDGGITREVVSHTTDNQGNLCYLTEEGEVAVYSYTTAEASGLFKVSARRRF